MVFGQGGRMRTMIVAAGLKIIPQTLQHKAIIKALNFLFSKSVFQFDTPFKLTVEIEDLKKSWHFKQYSSGFDIYKTTDTKLESFIVKSTLQTLLNCKSKFDLLRHVANKDVILKGEEAYVSFWMTTIMSLSHQDYERLIEQFYLTFRITRPNSVRLNVDLIEIADIRSDEDLEYIRDEALRLEEVDLVSAYKLMSIAKIYRPDGPLISQKFEEFQNRLNSN